MRRHRFSAVSHLLLATLLAFSLSTGCGAVRPSGAGKTVSPHAGAQVPDEFEVTLSLAPGQAWKSRFLSTSEIQRTLTDADGKKSVRSRTVGLELVTTQSVQEVAGGIARIEVSESSVRILQEGKFIDAPFLLFRPPNPVNFTLDTRTGKADFSEMEKAYGEWMTGMRGTPAWDILRKSFRLDSYVAQLKQLYGKPFTRHTGRKYAKGSQATVDKDLVLPFLGPSAALGPIPVEIRTWYEGFQVKGGDHALNLKGQYEGTRAWSADDLAGRLADFDAPVPETFQSTGTIRGRFESTVDVLSGREIRSTSHLDFSSSAMFGGSTLLEAIQGKSLIEPAN